MMFRTRSACIFPSWKKKRQRKKKGKQSDLNKNIDDAAAAYCLTNRMSALSIYYSVGPPVASQQYLSSYKFSLCSRDLCPGQFKILMKPGMTSQSS